MALTRVLRTQPVTLTHTWYSAGSETPVDPTGTPTVAVVAADSVSVQSGNATITGGGAGTTTFALNGVSMLEYLTVTWSATVASVSRTEVDYVEVVGARFFSLAEGRASDSSLSSTSTYPTATLERALLATEQECERICDLAFVPRYQRVTLSGNGSSDVLLAHSERDRSPNDVRSFRSVKMADTPDGTFTAFTADQLAALTFTPDGMLRRTDGNVFTDGDSNVIVEYEMGLDGPPPDLVMASKIRFRHWANVFRTGVPENAFAYSTPDGASFRLASPDSYRTGSATVDGVYGGYSRRAGAGTGDTSGSVPASRTLTYNPQAFSLFHRK